LRRRFPFAAAVALFFGVWPVAAARAQCSPPPGMASFTVAVSEAAVVYGLAATAEALAAQARSNGTRLGHGRRVLGLTVNRYDLRIRIAVDAHRTADGYCAYLRSAAIVAGAQPEIFVDGRFAAGTCQRAAILDHENEHAAIFRDAIARAAPAIDAAVRGAAVPAAMLVASQDEAEAAYGRAIRAALDPVLDAVRARAQVGNGRLDTPDHYAEIFRRCSDW
jgi:hypothetical protein